MENYDSNNIMLYSEYDNKTNILLTEIKPFLEKYNEEFFIEISNKIENIDDIIEDLIYFAKKSESKNLINKMRQGLEEHKQNIFNSIKNDLTLYRTIKTEFDTWILNNKLNEKNKIDFLWRSPLSITLEDYTESNENIIKRWLDINDDGKAIQLFIQKANNNKFNPILSINKPHRSYEAFLMIKCSSVIANDYTEKNDNITIENVQFNIENNINQHKTRLCECCNKEIDINKFNNGNGKYHKKCNSCRRKTDRLSEKYEKKMKIKRNNKEYKLNRCKYCNKKKDKFNNYLGSCSKICNSCNIRKNHYIEKEFNIKKYCT